MLTILNVAYPLAPVGPDAVGGAEQVLSALDRGLVARGHRSITVACAGSRVAGTLMAVPACSGPVDDAARGRAHAAHRRAIAEALACWPVDLVHFHGLDFASYLPPPGPPALCTLHLPLGWYHERALRPTRPDTHLHCVSASQRRLGQRDLRFLPDIPNGVPVAELAAPHRKRRLAVALGRICPEKGFEHALDAARAVDCPLLIGGQLYPYPEHEAYFARVLAPRLDRRRRFLGPVGFARKRRLLTAARCLLVASQCAETSSLVAMEALACGTPVVAFGNGALPEIVEHGVTGFIVRDVTAMADAIDAAASLDPAICRATARARFDVEVMVERYLQAYAALVPTRPLRAA